MRITPSEITGSLLALQLAFSGALQANEPQQAASAKTPERKEAFIPFEEAEYDSVSQTAKIGISVLRSDDIWDIRRDNATTHVTVYDQQKYKAGDLRRESLCPFFDIKLEDIEIFEGVKKAGWKVWNARPRFYMNVSNVTEEQNNTVREAGCVTTTFQNFDQAVEEYFESKLEN